MRMKMNELPKRDIDLFDDCTAVNAPDEKKNRKYYKLYTDTWIKEANECLDVAGDNATLLCHNFMFGFHTA